MLESRFSFDKISIALRVERNRSLGVAGFESQLRLIENSANMIICRLVVICCCSIGVIQLSNAAPRKVDLSQQRGQIRGDVTNRPTKSTDNVARNAIKFDYQKWPNGVVPYEIGPAFGESQTLIIRNAMKRIEKSTCLRFVQRTVQVDYVFIDNTNDGCYSAIGKEGGAQRLSLQHGDEVSCVDHATVIHELLHVAGLDHEQSRYDRDRFVTINYRNIEEGYDDQFRILAAAFSSLYSTPYDYSSVMHYSANAFAKTPELITIMPKDASQLSVIGKAEDASYYDLLKVNRIYNCPLTNSGVVDPTTNGGACIDQQPPKVCNGYLKFCASWSALRTECPKTCGFCQTADTDSMRMAYLGRENTRNTCKDTADDAVCSSYANSKFCTTWPLLERECRKSCGFCTV